MVTFLTEYEGQYRRTRQFCDRLVKLKLLEPMQANVSLRGGDEMALAGFEVISRERVAELKGTVLSKLVANGELELIYSHLFSMGNFAGLVDRVGTQQS